MIGTFARQFVLVGLAPSELKSPISSAAVGTHGYREAGGVVCQPVGDHTAVTIGVDVGGYGGRGR